jgi:hypothetical protein
MLMSPSIVDGHLRDLELRGLRMRALRGRSFWGPVLVHCQIEGGACNAYPYSRKHVVACSSPLSSQPRRWR